jgi:hypothetical protein
MTKKKRERKKKRKKKGREGKGREGKERKGKERKGKGKENRTDRSTKLEVARFQALFWLTWLRDRILLCSPSGLKLWVLDLFMST